MTDKQIKIYIVELFSLLETCCLVCDTKLFVTQNSVKTNEYQGQIIGMAVEKITLRAGS